jgi:hypothetical protein
MRRQYEEWTPRAGALDVLEKANAIITDYQAQGYDLTLRQLYYQFVSRGYLANTEQNYKRLGSIMDNARMAGLVDWSAIVDRTRTVKGNQHWSSPEQIIQAVGSSYRTDRWEGQHTRVEVWVEKEALAGIVGQVARELDVNYFACRGYVSSSAMYRAAQRIFWHMDDGANVVVVHLGDHDPSGIDMTRDNGDRLRLMVTENWRQDTGRSTFDMPEFTIRRVALNMDQVRTYDPPPNPAKMTDSRAADYVSWYGGSSWELDALDPTVLADLIRSEVLSHRDEELYARRAAADEEVRADLQRLTAVGWGSVRDFLRGAGE